MCCGGHEEAQHHLLHLVQGICETPCNPTVASFGLHRMTWSLIALEHAQVHASMLEFCSSLLPKEPPRNFQNPLLDDTLLSRGTLQETKQCMHYT